MEMMIVIALIALLMGTLVFGSGILGGANRRAAASLVVAGVRKGLAHANTTGKPVRLAIDLNSHTLTLEESSSSQALVGGDDEEDEEMDPAASLLADAEAVAAQILSGEVPNTPSFTPIDLLGGDGDGANRALPDDVRFLQVQTEHDEEPITTGVGYIYFWPGGLTERAVVQLARPSDDSGLTVEVSPLTGRAMIKRGLIELPEELFDDEEYSERDEP